MKFLIYEIWVRESIIEAPDVETAVKESQPAEPLDPQDGRPLHLSNWHAVAVEEK